MKKFLVLLVLGLLFSCQDKPTEAEEVIFNARDSMGDMVLPGDEVLAEGVVYGDSIQNEHYQCTAYPDSLEGFQIK